jgi:hypothetical protein
MLNMDTSRDLCNRDGNTISKERHILGRAIPQAVSRWLSTAAVRVQTRV